MSARWIWPIVASLMAMPATAETKQQIYDAAQAAFDKGEWAAAAGGFERILAPAGRSSRSDGVMRSRYAAALGQIGREEEALAQARRALGELGTAIPDEERAVAALTLANLLHADFQSVAAADAYEIARDATKPDSGMRLDAALNAVQAVAVADPPRAIRAADALIADPIYAAASKAQQAYLLALKARAQLNAGDATSAKATIAKAIAMTGSVGTGNTKVNLLQAIVRGDAALIYARGGNTDKAREYLAYSGGGYLPTTNWWGDGNRQPPVCDDEVKPEDVAVVAFQLDEHGAPIGAEAVYASRPGAVGAAFARAVKGWDASPTVGKLSLFWRSSLRIEMRCVTRPAPIEIAAAFQRAARDWWMARGSRRAGGAGLDFDGRPEPGDDALVTRLRAIRKDLGSDARVMASDDALLGAGAPPDVRAFMAATLLAGRTGGALGDALPPPFAPIVARLDASPDGGRAAAWMRLDAGLDLERGRRIDSARHLFEAVLALPERTLPADDAIRMMATLHLSMIDQRKGDGAAADARLRKAGLSAEQCSLFDVRPLPINVAVSNSIFPTDAIRWGFDGYLKEAFDIGADGRVSGVRTVMAYPPFVFGNASEKAVGNFRFQPPTLDGKVLGCASMMTNFRFVTPRR